MRRLALLLLPAAALALPACAPTGHLMNRASFDLDCSRDKLKIVDLDVNTKGVKGCGRRATYVWSCGRNQTCAWVMNSPQGESAPEK